MRCEYILESRVSVGYENPSVCLAWSACWPTSLTHSLRTTILSLEGPHSGRAPWFGLPLISTHQHHKHTILVSGSWCWSHGSVPCHPQTLSAVTPVFSVRKALSVLNFRHSTSCGSKAGMRNRKKLTSLHSTLRTPLFSLSSVFPLSAIKFSNLLWQSLLWGKDQKLINMEMEMKDNGFRVTAPTGSFYFNLDPILKQDLEIFSQGCSLDEDGWTLGGKLRVPRRLEYRPYEVND